MLDPLAVESWLTFACVPDGTLDVPMLACDPIEQTGCEPNRRCTFVIDSAPMMPILGTTRCFDEGTTDTGGGCTQSVGGDPDDCIGGLWCSSGECEEITVDNP